MDKLCPLFTLGQYPSVSPAVKTFFQNRKDHPRGVWTRFRGPPRLIGGSTLSGGEKQRVSTARAILKDTSIVLLDEAAACLNFSTGASEKS